MFHKHGGDIYTYENIKDFSANINYLGMPESVRQAAIEGIDGSLHYPDPEYRELRQALAKRESESCTGENHQDDIHAEQIICGNGAAELMFALAWAKQAKHALLAVPSFFEYEQALAANGCEIHRYELKGTEDFRLGTDFLNQLTDEMDILILGNPNNPTGQTIETALLDEIAELCAKRKIMLVLDESFFDFLSEAALKKTRSGVGLCSRYSNLFVLKSFTKMYAMPGLRFGYGICSDQSLLQRMREGIQPWNVSVPATEAAIAAAAEQRFARETAAQVEKNRQWMKKRMEEAGYKVYPSETNFLLFQGTADMKDRCLEKGYLIRDCSNFPGLAAEGKEKYFRICVRGREENEELLKVLI